MNNHHSNGISSLICHIFFELIDQRIDNSFDQLIIILYLVNSHSHFLF